jgi:hypothetical protein
MICAASAKSKRAAEKIQDLDALPQKTPQLRRRTINFDRPAA